VGKRNREVIYHSGIWGGRSPKKVRAPRSRDAREQAGGYAQFKIYKGDAESGTKIWPWHVPWWVILFRRVEAKNRKKKNQNRFGSFFN
jgi:hypothetical protein